MLDYKKDLIWCDYRDRRAAYSISKVFLTQSFLKVSTDDIFLGNFGVVEVPVYIVAEIVGTWIRWLEVHVQLSLLIIRVCGFRDVLGSISKFY